MTARLRIGLLVVAACGFAALLAWGLAGLPDFGHYPGPYGDLVARLSGPRRSMANTVTATVWDFRGFDTLGEELMLLAAASGTALLLRQVRDSTVDDVVDRVRSDALRAVGGVLAIATFLLGLQVIAHGFVTPGGGFQGGVIVAASFALLFLAVEYRAYHTVGRDSLVEPAEGLGGFLFAGVGLLALVKGLPYLQNFIEHGKLGRVQAGGSPQLVNWAAGIAVAAAFVLVFSEYLQDAMAGRHKAGRHE